MRQSEFEEFTRPRDENAVLNIADLANKTARTLLLGYNVNRNVFHVYIRDTVIWRLIYAPLGAEVDKIPLVISEFKAVAWRDVSLLIPDSAIFPEASDLEFCRLLRRLGYHLPFAKFNPQRGEQQFYGYVRDARKS